jgi:hypothetical protein
MTIRNIVTDGAPTVGGRPGDFGLALVVIIHGAGLVLCWDGPAYFKEFVSDARGGGNDSFTFDCIDHEMIEDGLFIVELVLIDDGPGDWPGSRESCLHARNFRQATPEEWKAHLVGDWPWEPLLTAVPPVPIPRDRCTNCGEYDTVDRPAKCFSFSDMGHNDIPVDEKGIAIIENVSLSDESFRALLGDDEP